MIQKINALKSPIILKLKNFFLHHFQALQWRAHFFSLFNKIISLFFTARTKKKKVWRIVITFFLPFLPSEFAFLVIVDVEENMRLEETFFSSQFFLLFFIFRFKLWGKKWAEEKYYMNGVGKKENGDDDDDG